MTCTPRDQQCTCVACGGQVTGAHVCRLAPTSDNSLLFGLVAEVLYEQRDRLIRKAHARVLVRRALDRRMP